MSKYSCNLCGISTDKKTDYNRHIQTKNHQKKVQQTKSGTNESKLNPTRIQQESSYKFKCMYCPNSYSTQSNMSKHMKKCANRVIIEKDKEMKDNEVETLKEKVEILQHQITTYEEMVKQLTCPKTTNSFTYIMNTYPNAPALEKLDSYTDMLEAKTMSLVEVVVMYYNDNKLDKFVGDFIVKSYKKDEPEEQAMWSSDISRLTYIINESYKNGKKNIWTYDKKGAKLKECIVEPALDYIREELVKYIDNHVFNTELLILKRKIAINEIIGIIDNDTLAKDIIRYIAPKFSIDKIKMIKN